jgi:hypothetical protein
MGYRFYTSREFAALRRADEEKERQRDYTMTIHLGGKVTFTKKLRRAPLVTRIKMATPVQTELARLIHLVPDDRQALAKMFMRLKNPSAKQLAACQRWIDRAKAT